MGNLVMHAYATNILATYSELLQRLQDDEIHYVGGNPVRRTIKGRDYWYAITHVGRKQVERYLGPDSEEMRSRVDRLKQQKQDLKEREKERGKLVRILREAGLPAPDLLTGKTLSALSRAGLFRLRTVLVGTHAYRCYPAMLGTDLAEATATTDDIDIAQFRPVSVAIDDHVSPKIQDALCAVGRFEERASLYPGQPTAWREASSGMSLELLTPNQGPDSDEPVELPALGVHAQPLRFLDFLIHDPAPAALLYRYGVLVSIPRPARYALHKLIVATRRRAGLEAKAQKDIRQAGELVEALAEIMPNALEDAWSEAVGRGPVWFRALRTGARRLPENARATLSGLVREKL